VDDKELCDRLNRLEASVKALETAANPALATNPSRVAQVFKFLVGNWVLLSFAVALCTAAYVKFVFGVDYFRDYRNMQAKSNLTDFYTHMGDVLMGRVEWQAAEDAYRNALLIDSGNIKATLGVAKAQIFKPAEGSQYYAPEVTDAKLAYLMSSNPEDDQLMFLKGVRLEDENDTDGAIDWYKKAIAKNPRSLGSFFQLGFIYMNHDHFNLDEAVTNLKHAEELDPQYPPIYENLGYIYLLTRDFPQAEKYLSAGYHLSPSWEKACSLADTYRAEGFPDSAINLRRWSLQLFQKSKPNDRTLGGTSSWNYMPLSPGDRDTIKETVIVNDIDQKKAFIHYGLSLDYAVKQDFKAADKERDIALSADQDHEYSAYFAELSESLEKLGPTTPAINQWLEQNQIKLRQQTP
jgi:tetratricopeptide (TPR) repeat protein